MVVKSAYLVSLVLFLAANLARADRQQQQPLQGPVDIRSDELLVLQKHSKAVFSGNVRVVQGELKITCRKLEVSYAGGDGRRDTGDIERMVFSGQVLIELEQRRGHCEQAVYQRRTGRIICTGRPWVEDERGRVRGEVIEYLLKNKKVKVTKPRAVIRLPEEESSPGTPANGKK